MHSGDEMWIRIVGVKEKKKKKGSSGGAVSAEVVQPKC